MIDIGRTALLLMTMMMLITIMRGVHDYCLVAGPCEHCVGRVRIGEGGPHGRRSAGASAAGVQGGGQQHGLEGRRQRAPRTG